jgi:hypothetical protein
MTDLETETVFRSVRWDNGRPICPHCGCDIVYECRRPSGAVRYRCKACRGDFSITSGTLFAFHKMPLRSSLSAIAIFVNEVKGKWRVLPNTADAGIAQDPHAAAIRAQAEVRRFGDLHHCPFQ